MAQIKINQQQFLLYQHYQKVHRLFFISAVSVIILSLIGISLVTLWVYGAADILFSLSISEPTSAPVTSQEPVAIIGSSPSPGILAYLTGPAPTTPAESSEPASTSIQPVEIITNLFDQQGSVVADGTVSSRGVGQIVVPQVNTSRPQFQGNVGIAKAYIFLELHSDPAQAITTSLYADDQGNWSWQSPRDLAAGLHALYLTVFDPAGEIKLAESQMQFEVVAVAPEQKLAAEREIKTKKVVLPPSYLDQRLALFDVNVKLSGPSAEGINPGDQIYAQVDLLNIGQPGVLVDAVVNYRILDQNGKIVYDEKETVAVAKQISYLKIFSTKPSFSAGEYNLEVNVAYDQSEAVSAFTFNVSGEPVIVLPGSRVSLNVSTVVQILVIVFSVAVILAYAEYAQVSALGKQLKMISERDLKNQKLIS